MDSKALVGLLRRLVLINPDEDMWRSTLFTLLAILHCM